MMNDYKKINSVIQRTIWFIFVFGLILLTAALFQNFIRLYSIYLSEFIRDNQAWGIVVFLATTILSAAIAFLTNLPLLPPAIAAWGEMTAFALLLAGWMLGAIAGYFIGYLALHRLAENSRTGRRVGYYRSKLTGKTEFWLVVVFRMSVPSEVSSYALGALRYHFGKFLLATFITELPFAWLAVYASRLLLEGRNILFAIYISAGLLAVVIASYYLKKRIGRGE